MWRWLKPVAPLEDPSLGSRLRPQTLKKIRAETCEEFHQQTVEQQRLPSGLIKVWSYLILSLKIHVIISASKISLISSDPVFCCQIWRPQGHRQVCVTSETPSTEFKIRLWEQNNVFIYEPKRILIVWMLLLLHRDVTADLFPAWKSEFLKVFWNPNDHECRSWRRVGWCFLFFSLSVRMCSAQVSAVLNAACVCLLYVCVCVRRRPYVSVRWRVRCHGNRHMAAITCSEEEGPSQRGGEVVSTVFNHQSVSTGTTMLI